MNKQVSTQSLEKIQAAILAGNLKTSFGSVERYDSKMQKDKAANLPIGTIAFSDAEFGEVIFVGASITRNGQQIPTGQVIAKIPVSFTVNGISYKFRVHYFTALAMQDGKQIKFNTSEIGDDAVNGTVTVWVTAQDEQTFVNLKPVAEAATV